MIKLKERFKKLKNPNLPNAKKIAKKHGHKKIIKLYYNENKYSSSPKVKEVIKINNPNIYPEYKDPILMDKLSKTFNIDSSHFYFSNGSDAILDSIPNLFIEDTKKENIIIPSLTFGRIETTALINSMNVKKIDLLDGLIDLDATYKAIDENTSIIYIVNPNMPTGKLNSHEKIQEFLDKVPSNILVVLDEAYGEYAFGLKKNYQQNKELIEKYENIIITHTFSKIYALAGFRIGYMIAKPYIVDLFKKAYQYLPVNKYSIQAASAVLSDIPYYEKILKIINKEKEKYYSLLEELNLKYYKSYGNFIYIYVEDNKKFQEYLVSKYAILIRSINDNAIRITIGTPKENSLVFKCLREYYG